MTMLNKVYSTMTADYRVTRRHTGRYEAYVRPMGEGWMYAGTFDTAEEAFQHAENTAEAAEIMARYDDYDYCY